MLCWSEVATSAGAVVTRLSMALVVLCVGTFGALRLSQRAQASAVTATYVLSVVALAATCTLRAPTLLTVGVTLLGLASRIGLRQLHVAANPCVVVLLASTLLVGGGVISAFVAVELISVAALLMIVWASGLGTPRRALLVYFWVSAACAIAISSGIILAHTLVGGDSIVGVVLVVVVYVACVTKVGALPTGLWVLWFYSELPLETLSAYIVAVYPSLVLSLYCLCVAITATSAVPVVSVCTLIALVGSFSGLVLVSSSFGRSRLMPTLLALLTTSTFIFALCAV